MRSSDLFGSRCGTCPFVVSFYLITFADVKDNAAHI